MSKKQIKQCLIILLGSAILAFGLYNIHSISNITEGGILGLNLLLHHHFGISPSISNLIFNILFYSFGFFILGKDFIFKSAVSGVGFSGFYAIFERFEPIYPQIANYPLIASITGAIFVGVGVGLCIRYQSAPTGDDALVLGLEKVLKNVKIQWIYLICDVIVLGLSLTYIQFSKIIYSLISVIISGQIVGFIQKFNVKKAVK